MASGLMCTQREVMARRGQRALVQSGGRREREGLHSRQGCRKGSGRKPPEGWGWGGQEELQRVLGAQHQVLCRNQGVREQEHCCIQTFRALKRGADVNTQCDSNYVYERAYAVSRQADRSRARTMGQVWKVTRVESPGA